MMASGLPISAVIDFADLGTGSLLIVGRWNRAPAAMVSARIVMESETIDLSRNILSFADETSSSSGFRFLAVCVCKTRPRAKLRVSLAVTLTDEACVSADALISRQPDVFAKHVTSYEPQLRRLLQSVDRLESYRLETALWPDAGEREEVDQLSELGADLALAIDFCCVPIANTLLVAASLADPAEQIVAIDLFHGDGDIPFARALLPYELAGRPAETLAGRPPCGLFIIVEFDEHEMVDEDFVLLLATRRGMWTKSLKPRLRFDRGMNVLGVHLQGMDPNLHLLIFEQLAGILAARGDHGENAAGLRHLRGQAIAELPDKLDRADLGCQFFVDAAHRAGAAGLLLVGWALIDPVQITSVTVHAASEGASSMLDRWVRHERRDVWESLHESGQIIPNYRLGFICFAAIPINDRLAQVYATIGWRDGTTRRQRIKLEAVMTDSIAAVGPILAAFEPTHPELRRLLDQHIGPAIRGVWSARRPDSRDPDIRVFGTPPAAPGVSLIIPIYSRFDFIEFQIAKFVDDAGVREQDIIYVLDDPLIFEQVLALCIDVSAFYEVPFRLVCAGRRMGFAAATNLGASLARGGHILLLNSDVLPIRSGWLSELMAAYQVLDTPGVIAPRLIYEDGSTQHEGMRFIRHQAWGDMWVNDHSQKGQPGRAGQVPVEIDSLTGACLLLERSLFNRVGGLCEDYIIGDFEDSDLCLKLLVLGRRNWLVPSVSLHHLERQSREPNERAQLDTNLSLINCWIHHDRWDAEISRRAVR